MEWSEEHDVLFLREMLLDKERKSRSWTGVGNDGRNLDFLNDNSRIMEQILRPKCCCLHSSTSPKSVHFQRTRQVAVGK